MADYRDWRAAIANEPDWLPLAVKGAQMTPLGERLAFFLRRHWPFVRYQRLLDGRAESLALRDECVRMAIELNKRERELHDLRKLERDAPWSEVA